MLSSLLTRAKDKTYSACKSPKTPPPAATKWAAARCFQRAHTIRMHVGVSAALSAFLSLVTLTFDLDIQTQARFLHNAPNRQVSSSYVKSFGSYRVDKQTDKLTNKQTPLKNPPHCAMIRRWVNSSSRSCFITFIMHWWHDVTQQSGCPSCWTTTSVNALKGSRTVRHDNRIYRNLSLLLPLPPF